MNHSQEQDLCLQSCNISISFSADSTQLFTVLQLFLNSLRSLGPHVFLVFSAVYEPTVRRGATHRIAICWREKYCRLCALRIIDLEVSLPIRGKARFSVSVWSYRASFPNYFPQDHSILLRSNPDNRILVHHLTFWLLCVSAHDYDTLVWDKGFKGASLAHPLQERRNSKMHGIKRNLMQSAA